MTLRTYISERTHIVAQIEAVKASLSDMMSATLSTGIDLSTESRLATKRMYDLIDEAHSLREEFLSRKANELESSSLPRGEEVSEFAKP
jgi:hypothetical protein